MLGGDTSAREDSMKVNEEIAKVYWHWRRKGGKVNTARRETGLSSQTINRVCKGECSLSTAEILANFLGYELTIKEVDK